DSSLSSPPPIEEIASPPVNFLSQLSARPCQPASGSKASSPRQESLSGLAPSGRELSSSSTSARSSAQLGVRVAAANSSRAGPPSSSEAQAEGPCASGRGGARCGASPARV